MVLVSATIEGTVLGDTKVDRLLEWEAGGCPGPWLVTLFPTNRCNLRCKICWQRGAGTTNWTDETPDARLLELVRECAEVGVRDWCIIGGGEPFIRGELLMSLCERIRSFGMNGALQTNGTLLRDDYLEHLVEIGWSRINVSLDGPTQAINDDIRSSGSFERACAAMRRLAETKRKRRVDAPIASLYVVLTAANYDKIDRMVELAHSLGCVPGGVQLSTMVVHSEEGEPYKLGENQKAELPEHIERALNLAERYGMENNFALYLEEEILADPNAMVHRSDPRAKGMLRALCYEPWLSVAITAEGNAGPCCAFWDPNSDNINDKAFRKVWLGPYLRHVRESLLANRAPDYCSRCPSILFAQSKVLHEELRWRQMGLPQRAAFLVRKIWSSLRRHGLVRAIHRGREWARMHASG
jgi:MoaA/NifB/PqqE/SkfB family radical SAM enzyme